MCSADISPMVLTWASFQAAPTADLQYNHECANWDAFEDWTRSRQVDPFTPGLITHPKLGMLTLDSFHHRSIFRIICNSFISFCTLRFYNMLYDLSTSTR